MPFSWVKDMFDILFNIYMYIFFRFVVSDIHADWKIEIITNYSILNAKPFYGILTTYVEVLTNIPHVQ